MTKADLAAQIADKLSLSVSVVCREGCQGCVRYDSRRYHVYIKMQQSDQTKYPRLS